MRRTRFEARIAAIEMARVLFGEPEGPAGAESGETAADRAERRQIDAALAERGEIDG